mmetsp:Transcript_62706/g.191844  ORF Transcript_62706/g.191844 Transcript_62706/m.191844 type:complete len:88 (-) Transcript_62706:50-313(-)
MWSLGGASLEELLVEFSRFFVLKVLFQDVAAPGSVGVAGRGVQRKHAGSADSCRFSPSSAFDKVWHEMLLFRRRTKSSAPRSSVAGG